MEKNIFEAFQPNSMERLGECYCQDDSYKQSMIKEKEIEGRLKESLTEEQMALVEKYYASISATMGVCELLVYRQGVRDMVGILYSEEQEHMP